MTSTNSESGDDTSEQQTSLEEQFLIDDEEPDEFDEELAELVRTRERGSVLRPILMILVVLLVSWVIYDWRSELSYFFTPPEPVDVGEVADFASKAAEEPDWQPPIAHNTYVSIEGMPTRRTSGGGYQFFRLQGAEIYVQQQDPDAVDDDDDLVDDGSSLPARDMAPGLPIDEHRQWYRGEGRLISFRADPERVAGLKEFYGDQYNIRFCEDYSERQIEDLENQRIEMIRQNWAERYREASEEERRAKELTPEPTDAEERQLLDSRPVCVDGYFLQDDRRPIDHWWYVLFSVLLALFAAFNVLKLYRWFKDWLRP